MSSMAEDAASRQHREVIERNRAVREATQQEAQRLADQRRAQQQRR